MDLFNGIDGFIWFVSERYCFVQHSVLDAMKNEMWLISMKHSTLLLSAQLNFNPVYFESLKVGIIVWLQMEVNWK